MSAHGSEGGGVRKTVIVLLLVGGLILLHRFAVRTVGFDPSAMLALGFVVLASYAFGQLVGRFGLPHLTGYILAGLALGPSAVHYFPESWQVPPFDQGVLSESVIGQLRVFETLAVALIALAAGGQLRIALLKRGVVQIAGMIAGHILIAGPIAFGFLLAIAAWVPAVRMPGLEDIALPAAIAMCAIVTTVVISTSPAAAVAVVAETRARGPVTEMALAGVVLRDVFSVILFSVAVALAGHTLGHESQESVGWTIARSLGGAALGGVIVGVLMMLYLRFIRAELLLFVTGAIFTASYVASRFGVDPVLMFIVAGFVAVNFSSAGETLLQTVEQLFLPVSVVFFTLAGARLHLDVFLALAPFAASLVAVRGIATFVGVRTGLTLTRAPIPVRRYAWVAYVPQAGVALSLATLVGSSFGELGGIFETLLVGGIALNEVVGPVLLKLGLTRAGEVGKADAAPAADEEPAKEAEGEPAPSAELAPWPVPDRSADAWGPPLATSSPKLDEAVRELTFDLVHVARSVQDEALASFREEALAHVRELRREFLRHHHRVTVMARGGAWGRALAAALRLEQAELAEKWRASILARAARVRSTPTWEAGPIVDSVDAISDAVPETIEAAYEAESLVAKEGDGVLKRLARLLLRARIGFVRLWGDAAPPRRVPLRALARYHLWGRLPERLEPVAALHAQAEAHVVARTRSIFDGLVVAYDALAVELEGSEREAPEVKRPDGGNGGGDGESRDAGADAAPVAAGAADAVTDAPVASPELTPEQIEERLRAVRQQVEEDLVLAVQEVERIAEDVALRTSQALGACLRDLKRDAVVIGTPDLSMRRRAASKLYRSRDEALRWIERGMAGARETASALYNRLALEMELIALEGRVKDALEEHATALGRDVRGRAHRQVERVSEAIGEAHARLNQALNAESTPQELARAVREACEPVVRLAAEAARVAALLRDQLTDERAVTGVLDALTRAAQSLTDRYRIPAGPVAHGEHRLPPPVATVEVPFREWVVARIETGLAPRLVTCTREVAAKVEPLAQALSELERRVAFNVELATSELSVVEDERVPAATKKLLREMLVGALERHREVFLGHGDASAGWGEEARTLVRDAVLGGLEELRTGIVDGEVGRLRYQMVRDVRGRRAARFLKELRGAVRRSWIIGTRALREAIGEARLDRIRVRLGLPVRLAEQDIGERSFEPPAPTASIPMVYKRLFSAQALEAGDILTGRDEQLRRAMNVLEGRTNAALRTVAIVGPDGVGKSAFVNAVVRSRRWPKVHELALKEPASVEQVDALFEAGMEGHLVVISGLHWLRSMRPGGFEPLRRFVGHVLADRGKNAFLLRADSLTWAQSCQAAPLAEVFPEIVRLDPLDPEALSAAVLARHAVSGYGLVFHQGETPESRLEEIVLQVSAPLSRPQDSFFRALHAASGGLLRDALRLWLASVEQVDEAGDFVHLGPVPTPAIYALRKLDDAQVLTLYQVARQGWMDAEVLASLYRTDVTSAEAQLGVLAHLGILERKGSVWRIAVHLRGSIYRLLRERGYVA